jgi:hypothetical protein
MALTSKDMANFDPALKLAYDKYVDNIMRGATQYEAAMRAGASHSAWQDWIRSAETDPYVIQLMKERLESMKVLELWNEHVAILKLARLADDTNAKDSTRFMAMKELNVLCGITQVDEAGRTRKVPTMEDMYGDTPESDAPQP